MIICFFIMFLLVFGKNVNNLKKKNNYFLYLDFDVDYFFNIFSVINNWCKLIF